MSRPARAVASLLVLAWYSLLCGVVAGAAASLGAGAYVVLLAAAFAGGSVIGRGLAAWVKN